ncbi:hypothetical protein [Streptomyces sp. NPDC014685]|uniref:hypothetical protein n=1 Tax=Streptomyces sp. NPDC014685 TaxID=3364881 RepID=UPI0036F7766A
MEPFAGLSGRYRAAAERAGLVRSVGDGQVIVGKACDAATGDTSLFVASLEFPAGAQAAVPVRTAERRTRGDSAHLDDLVRTAVREARRDEALPESTGVTVRLSPTLRLPAPWHLARTYLWWHGVSGPHGAGPPEFPGTPGPRRTTGPDASHDSEVAPDAFRARPSEPADLPLIEAWLAQAMIDGYREAGRGLDHDQARAAAAGLYADRRRSSFVAPAAGRARGHATTLVRVTDQVSGTEHVELSDVLVEDGPGKAALRRGLVQACIEQAGRLRLPMLGHVIHRHPTLGPDQATGVVDGLLAKGWRPAFRYWSLGDTTCL